MHRPTRFLATCLVTPFALAACSGGTSGGAPFSSSQPLAGTAQPSAVEGTSPNVSGSAAPAASTTGAGHVVDNYYGQPLPPPGGATAPLQVGCDWFRVYDADVSASQGNTAFPDTASVYWIAAGPTQPSSDESITIDGNYPASRYFSFQAYNENSQLADGLTDYQIQPAPGGVNPFAGPTVIDAATRPGDAYSARLTYQPAPGTSAPRAVNTLYRGTNIGLAALSQTRVTTALIYRVYLSSTQPADATGGVGLPKLTFHGSAGNIPLANSPDAANCRQIVSNYLASLSSTQTVSLTAPTNPPKFAKYFGVAGGVAGQGTAKNSDTSFLYARTTATAGNIVMIRGRAPTFTQQPDAPSIPDVRYWSICQNNYTSQQVVACVADQDAVVDRSGYYNVVISAPAARPALATAANGYNWLPQGVNNSNAVVIYRNMLASAGFTQSVQNVPQRQSPVNTMDDYAPQISYCSPAAFTTGASPAQVFDNCQASASGGGLLGGLLGGGGLGGLLGG